MHTLADQLMYLRNHILSLPYDDRAVAKQLLNRWQSVRRLSQLEQLRVDKLIEYIDEHRVHVRVGVQKEK